MHVFSHCFDHALCAFVSTFHAGLSLYTTNHLLTTSRVHACVCARVLSLLRSCFVCICLHLSCWFVPLHNQSPAHYITCACVCVCDVMCLLERFCAGRWTWTATSSLQQPWCWSPLQAVRCHSSPAFLSSLPCTDPFFFAAGTRYAHRHRHTHTRSHTQTHVQVRRHRHTITHTHTRPEHVCWRGWVATAQVRRRFCRAGSSASLL